MEDFDMTKQVTNLRYLVMPDFVYEDDRLTDVSRRVYCFIHTFKGEFFYFSNEHMAKMFKCNKQSISNAIKQLIDLEYIKTTYKVKADGGKIRFVTDRLLIELYSDYKQSYSQTISRVIDNGSKINGNKIKDNIYKTLEFLEKIPEKDMEKFKDDFQLNEVVIKLEGQKAADWCRSKGRRQKDYKAFFRNWLRNHKNFNKNSTSTKQFEAENTSKYDKYVKP